MTKSQRWIILLSLLVFTLGLVVWFSRQSEQDPSAFAVVESATRSTNSYSFNNQAKSTPDAASMTTLDSEKSQNGLPDHSDPFAVRSWYVAPPPLKPELPPKPTAPPLPFRYLGMLKNSDGAWLVQLALGNEEIIATEGETIGDIYHLDSLQDGNLIFTYMPLGMRQSLPVILDSDL